MGSTFLNATGVLISDNYLLERSPVLNAPSKKLKDRRKLLTMGCRRCISSDVKNKVLSNWWVVRACRDFFDEPSPASWYCDPQQTLTNKTSMPSISKWGHTIWRDASLSGCGWNPVMNKVYILATEIIFLYCGNQWYEWKKWTGHLVCKQLNFDVVSCLLNLVLGKVQELVTYLISLSSFSLPSFHLASLIFSYLGEHIIMNPTECCCVRISFGFVTLFSWSNP